MNREEMYQQFGISADVLALGKEVLHDIEDRFASIDERAEINQLKVIHAMQKNRVSESHLWGSTGYGYNDSGRDTLEKVYADIFHCEDALVRSQITCGTHAEFGISYRQVDLVGDSEFDYEGIRQAINEKTKLVTIQRSKGYALRKTFSVDQIGKLIRFIKSVKSNVICMVDNCYGEFVETIEPTDVGADLCVGSLIKIW